MERKKEKIENQTAKIYLAEFTRWWIFISTLFSPITVKDTINLNKYLKEKKNRKGKEIYLIFVL